MACALFVMMPSIGHINATLNLARTFSSLGYETVFTGGLNLYIDTHIERQGFRVVKFASIPFGLNYFDELDYYKRLDKTSTDLIRNRFNDSTYRQRNEAYLALINSTAPDYIFLDAFIGGDFLCLYPFLVQSSIKFAFLNTMSATLRPELLRWPSATKWVTALKMLHESVFMLGNTNRKLIRKKRTNLGLPTGMKINFNGLISTTFDNIKEYVLSARALADDHQNPNKIFLGLQVLEKRNDIITDNDKHRLSSLFKQNRKIIFTSLGTESSKNKKTSKLIRSVIKAAGHFSDFDFIIANSKHLPSLDRQKKPSNIYLFDMVPQTFVLSKASLFITHGGLNSIKESVRYRVPMLVVPLKSAYDQPMNARKVIDCRIGVALTRHQVSVKKIKTSIEQLLENVNFKENLCKISDDDKAEFTNSKIEELINLI